MKKAFIIAMLGIVLAFTSENTAQAAERGEIENIYNLETMSDTPTDYSICCEALKVRNNPTFESDKVKSIPYGGVVSVSKTYQTEDGSEIWGETDDGYICLYSGRLAHAKINIDMDTDSISDTEILARLMMHEARWEGTEGLTAVAEVVRNRMESDLFPDTLREVVFQPGQFENASEIAICYPTEEALEIAQNILDGEEGVLKRDDILYFRNAHGYTGNWGKHKFVTEINHHCFYTQV